MHVEKVEDSGEAGVSARADLEKGSPPVKVPPKRRRKGLPVPKGGTPEHVKDLSMEQLRRNVVPENEVKENEEKEEDENPKHARLTQAAQKRAAKAKLAFQKLSDNLGSQDCKEILLPGPAFDKLSWTALPLKLGACKIGVVLYSENFYVYKDAMVPEYLMEKHQAWY